MALSLNEAVKLHQAGRLPEAMAAYRAILKKQRDSFDAHHLLGIALCQSGRAAEGVDRIAAALRIKPGSKAAQLSLAQALQAAGRFADARAAYELLLDTTSSDARVSVGLAACITALGDPQRSIAILEPLLKRGPRSADVLNEMGKARAGARQLRDAVALFQEALRVDPRLVEAANNLATALSDLNEYEAAAAILEKARGLAPRSLPVLLNLARLRKRQWQSEEALVLAREAFTIAPENHELRSLIGHCLLDLGRNDEAESWFREALARGEAVADVMSGLVQITSLASGGPEENLIDKALVAPAETQDNLESLYFSKAKIAEDNGEFAHAIELATKAKSLKPLDNRMTRYRENFARARAAFDRSFFAKWMGADQTEQPVFIVGMPRSGTTLVEQIIASHPQAAGAGEMQTLPHLARRFGYPSEDPSEVARKLGEPGILATLATTYLTTLRHNRQGALRITDKLPHNFENLWLIRLLFPKARIVHCLREPADVCVSIYLRNFSDDHWYARDLALLGQYYRCYEKVVAHWRDATGLAWHELSYEKLIAEGEAERRKLIAFLGLEWDDACLDHRRSERGVVTFSKAQVRKPIYNTSVERWRRFEPYIRPLLDELESAEGRGKYASE